MPFPISAYKIVRFIFIGTATLLLISCVSETQKPTQVRFSYEKLLRMVEESAVQTLCADKYRACLELSAAQCNREVSKIVRGPCSVHVPEDGVVVEAGTRVGIDRTAEVGKAVGGCAGKALFTRHKATLQKNIFTSACKGL
jgi:hypothetical protein